MSAPLRILAIVNLPWDARLGAARVFMELAEEWTRAGHVVEKFCLIDAFPKPTSSSVVATFRTALFPLRARAFVRQNHARFDVIDCLIGTLPYRKRRLGFRGLLVARSVGLHRLYRAFLEGAGRRWPGQPQGKFSGRIFHGFFEARFQRNSEVSLQVCDLLNLPNDDERAALTEIRVPALVEPYGLSDRFREELGRAAAPAAERLRRRKIGFIGTWSLRKGSRDWRQIIATLRARHPDVELLLLGTMLEESAVREELGCERVICLPKYAAVDLPALLADCTLALFPSYIEGFGLAVLEQLAAGLPTIAYDVPGPRQILPACWLTPVGEPAAMAARAAEILELSLSDYEAQSAEARALAAQFRWSNIAASTAGHYRAALESLGR